MRHIKLVVIGPSDTEAEKTVACEVAFDATIMLDALQIAVIPSRFETDVPAGLDKKGAQGLADYYLDLRNADYVVAIFKAKFGTPVWDADSGTAHEILDALRSFELTGGPQLMLYIAETVDTCCMPDSVKIRQLRDVCTGKWTAYRDAEDLRRLLGRELVKRIIEGHSRRLPVSPLLQCIVSCETANARYEGQAEAANDIEFFFICSPGSEIPPLRIAVYLNTNLSYSPSNIQDRPCLIVGHSVTFSNERSAQNGAIFNGIRIQADPVSGIAMVTLKNTRFNASQSAEGHSASALIQISTMEGNESISVSPAILTIARLYTGLVTNLRTSPGNLEGPLVYDASLGLNPDFMRSRKKSVEPTAYLTFQEGFPGAFKSQKEESSTHYGLTAQSGTCLLAMFNHLEYFDVLVSRTNVNRDGTAGTLLRLIATTESGIQSNVQTLETYWQSDLGVKFVQLPPLIDDTATPRVSSPYHGASFLASWEWICESRNASPITATIAIVLATKLHKPPPWRGVGTVNASLAPIRTASNVDSGFYGPVPRFLTLGQRYFLVHSR